MTEISINNSTERVYSDKSRFKKKLYAINLPSFEKAVTVQHLNTRELNCQIIENGIILPLRKTELSSVDAIYEGGVSDENFNFVAGHKRNDNGKNNNYETIRSYKPNEVDYINEIVIYAGTAFSHFGHFLLESLSRLWWIVKNKRFDLKIVFLKNRPFNAPFLQLLELIGIKEENIIFLERPTKFKQVFVPEQSLCFASYYHKEFLLTYDAILEKIIPDTHEKIYLSRTRFPKKDFINEEFFEEFYRDRGFKIIYPEQLSIKEQIALIAGADQIVSTIGTISHLALFAKKNTKLISLLRSRTFFTKVQLIINQARELDYTFLDVTCNILPHRYSANCFYIGPNVNWKEFVKKEYELDLNFDLYDYFNSSNSRLGDYFKLWLKVFSTQSGLNKIKKDNSLDILENLEVIFANEPNNFTNKSATLASKILDKLPEKTVFSGKSFVFSRYDGSYARQIYLDESGLIKTVNRSGHDNESFWTVKDNELTFLNKKGKLTSRYFCVKERTEGFLLLGYYEFDKEIIFKLQEVV